MALNLIMLGPPGAGKGTQAERFARSRGIPKISTGDILREAVHAGTEVGKRARAIMDRGELVSDEVMIGIVRERLERPDALNGFILDGFPRTPAQATALDGIMQGRDPLIVVDIVVPESELVRRLSTRLICDDCGANAEMPDGGMGADRMMTTDGGASVEATTSAQSHAGAMRCRRCGGVLVQRSDDSDAVVLERLKVYRANTKPLVDFYRSRPTFRSISGAQPPDRVAADLAAAIEAASQGALPASGVDARGART
jgi:adenylate kinase